MAGRPKIEIDKQKFEDLCALQCTLLEIADQFDVSEDTIERWCKRTYGKTFREVFERKRSGGKISLRRAQFQLAQKNAVMAIWLGKQMLGQQDSIQIDMSDNDQVMEFINGMRNDKA